MGASKPVTSEGAENGGAALGNEVLLEATDVSKRFGGLLAVDTVTFSIPRQTIVSIIGPNGAGKTTFFNMLTGLYKPTTGRVTFDGQQPAEALGHVRRVEERLVLQSGAAIVRVRGGHRLRGLHQARAS